MVAGRHLEKSKIMISPQPFDRSWCNFAQWFILPLQTPMPIKFQNLLWVRYMSCRWQF